MGGDIWVENPSGLVDSDGDGPGSTFHFTARFGLQDGGATLIMRPQPAELSGVPVLVVDDSATVRRILTETLEGWAMMPAAADSGPQALEALEEAGSTGRPFSVLVVDADLLESDEHSLATQIRLLREHVDTPLVLLTTVGRRDDPDYWQELGVASRIPKPVKLADFQKAIVAVLGGRPVGGHRVQDIVPVPPALNVRPMKILLAEDDPVKRQVAVRMLEKQGHTVATAENGRVALDIVRTAHFDLLLLDMGMPEMDGYEVAAAVRAREKGSETRGPIVALTAGAMKGDRERCLEAGMDGYFSKPFRGKELYQAIEVHQPDPAKISDDRANGAQPAELMVFDSESALSRVEGDVGLLEEVVRLYLDEAPGMLSEVRHALDRGEGDGIERAAHRLRGSVAIFGAERSVEAARTMEELGRQRDLTGAEEAWPRLAEEIGRLDRSLEPLSTQRT